MNKLIKIFTDYLPILFLDFTDQEAVQRFFLQEVQLGEELLAQGDIEAGVSVPFKHGILTLSNPILNQFIFYFLLVFLTTTLLGNCVVINVQMCF